MTTRMLKERGQPPLSSSKFITFMGTCALIEHFEFSSRRTLLKHEASSKQVPAFKIGEMMGMSRSRNDAMCSSLMWSQQPKDRPNNMPSLKNR